MGDIDIPANFKTSLPPRKRAKTKEEKEQRRIERILRNRKAAHASREKKRKHVEFLECYVLDLEKQMYLVKQLNEKLLTHYHGGDNEIDNMMSKLATLPDLQAKKLQHATELDSVGCDEDDDEEQEQDHSPMQMPKTPESFTSSPKSQHDDVPELVESRGMSICTQSESESSYSPFASQHSSPVTVDKFSLDIITAEPHSNNTFMTNNNQMFLKKETVDAFIPQMIPEVAGLNPLDQKVNFDDFHVKLEDETDMLDELRNPAVIAADALMIDVDGAHDVSLVTLCY